MSSNIRAMFDELAQILSLPEIKLNKEDSATIVLNNNISVYFNYIAKNNTLLIYAALGQITNPLTYKRLLLGNFLWKETNGATLCLTPEAEEVLLAIQISTNNLDSKDLAKIIEMFLEDIQKWQKIITNTEAMKPSKHNTKLDTVDNTNPDSIKI